MNLKRILLVALAAACLMPTDTVAQTLQKVECSSGRTLHLSATCARVFTLLMVRS